MKSTPFWLTLALAAHVLVSAAPASPALDIQFIDVEGGQSTLVVAPNHRSLLVDAGYSGGRDVARVARALANAGVARIDVMLVSHMHRDHAGGVPELATRVPVGTFVDYGAPLETIPEVTETYEAYIKARGTVRHLIAKPGLRIPLDGMQVDVVSAAGDVITKPLSGAGEANPACSAFVPHAADTTENRRAVGVRIKFGDFVFLDLADLPWNEDARLVCPRNLLGVADLYLAPHHGNDDANLPAMLTAVRPRVVVVNNGTTKGGYAETLKGLNHLAGLETLWQLHRSLRPGAENAPEALLVNIAENDSGFALRARAARDGSFTVSNERTGELRAYARRSAR